MPSIYHPFETDTLYELSEDGNIRVSKGNGVGIFTPEGIHVSGEIRHADPQLCVWVGNNPDLANVPMIRPGRSTIIPKPDSD